VLSRRTRALLLDARASLEAAPKVAAIMAKELGRDESWTKTQVAAYSDLARGYILKPPLTPPAPRAGSPLSRGARDGL